MNVDEKLEKCIHDLIDAQTRIMANEGSVEYQLGSGCVVIPSQAPDWLKEQIEYREAILMDLHFLLNTAIQPDDPRLPSSNIVPFPKKDA